jgi:FixJ family two-component response regulator
MAASNTQQNSTVVGHVFLIEDDDELRDSLSEILTFVGYRVHAFANPIAFFEGFQNVVPAVVLTDVRMPNMTGIDLQAELIKRGSKVPVVFISGQSTVPQTITAMKQGAIDFLMKPFSREDLLAAIAKGIELDSQLMRQVIRQSEFEQKLSLLSPRERQVFTLLAKGYSNSELVDELGVALSTVKEYKSEMMYKLRLRSLSELIALSASVSMRL